jgi:uncharacterized protein UPF0758
MSPSNPSGLMAAVPPAASPSAPRPSTLNTRPALTPSSAGTSVALPHRMPLIASDAAAPSRDRPRERLLAEGARTLSDADLLAVLLGTEARS